MQPQVDEGRSGHFGDARQMLEFYSVPPCANRPRCALGVQPESSRCPCFASQCSPCSPRWPVARRRRRRAPIAPATAPAAPANAGAEAVRRAAAAAREPAGISADLSAGLRRRLRDRARHRAEGRRRASRATATTAPAGRTASRSARRNDTPRIDECAAMKPSQSQFVAVRGLALPRAHLGRPGRAQARSCCTAGWT